MNPKKILIIRNDHIGDLVLSTGAIREVKKAFPESEITLIVNKLTRPLIEKNKNVDKILELDTSELRLKRIVEYFKMSNKIRKEKFDIGIDLRGSIMNSFFLLKLAGIKKRIGKTDLNPKIKFLLTDPIDIDYDLHMVDTNLKIINKGLKISSKNNDPEIITDEQDDKEVKEFLRKQNINKYICLCPFAGLEKKQWPIEKWKKIIKWLEEFDRQRRKILLLGTKNESELLKQLSILNKNTLVVLDFNLREMSLLFKKADLVITQDGGPMHIAWISGAKLIEIHNLFLKWLNKFIPLGKNSKIVYTKTREMVSVSVDEVKKAIGEIL